MSAVANIFTPMQSTNQGSIISVRTSDTQLQSTAPSGGQAASYTMHTQMARSVSSAVFNQGSSSAYSVKGTTSFMAIHSEVSESVTVQSAQPTIVHQRSSGRGPGGNSSGMLTPAGDMLLPMLAMACVYVIFKLFRNRKTSQTL